MSPGRASPLRLPMLPSHAASPVRQPAPDGWEFRFVAAGDRVGEVERLYRELGFEVALEAVPVQGPEPECRVCFTGQERLRAIYTRRPRRPASTEEA